MNYKSPLRALLLFALCVALSTSTWAQKKKKNDKEEKQEEPKHYLEKMNIGGLSFRSVGPALTSGRIADVAVHPDNQAVWYVATASGGVWKTENAGTTFKPIFDGQGSYSIGCITLDPSNPNIVWVGTGENNNQRSVAYGDGIYKSEDGGASWKHMGLKTSEHIGKILVHPDNSDVIYVAAIGPLWSEGGERGVYKSVDGGKNWEAILTVDEHTGVNDIVMDPRNPDVMYASAYQRRRRVFTYVGGGPGSGMYRTKDGGKTWDKANKGLPGEMGRIGLAISPANPEYIYAIVEAQSGKGGFYRSENRGASWSKRSGYSTSGNYYQEIIAHPTNPDIVYSMNTWMQITRDGGKSFQGVGETHKHVDNHSLYIDPDNPKYLLAGCDGGLYESFDEGKTWNFKANLPVTQFYKVAVDNDVPFYNIAGGTQDNFSLLGPSRTRSNNGIGNSDWIITQGGDGFESQIDPENPNIVYAQAQYGVLSRFDKQSGEGMGIQPKPRKDEEAYRWNWDAPLAVSTHDPARLYFAANKLFRSDSRGDKWDVISPDLTRQIDRNTLKVMGRVQSMDAIAKNGSTSPYGAIVAFSESSLNENLLVVGTDDGLIQITEDGGQNWRKVENFPDVPERTYVNAVLTSQHDENVIYAVFNNHKNGDFKPYVYKSSDKGQTWNSITNNLPERGSTYTIAEDHVEKDLLFVGTEFSCFFTMDGGTYWKKLSRGLPPIAVRDIAIQQRENDLVLGTFGRGFYVMDDYSPLRSLKEENLTVEGAIMPIKDGLLFIESSPLGLRGKSFQGDNYFNTPNPPVGVDFTYFVKDEVKTLKAKRQKKEKEKIKKGEDVAYPTYEELVAEQQEESPYLLFTIKDTDGNVIRKLKKGISKGVNRIHWDGRYASVSPVSLSSSSFYNPFAGVDQGILVMPGDYTVTMSKSVNGELTDLTDAVKFTLKTLGGVTLPAKDRAALVEFQREAQKLQRAVDGAGRIMNEINNRMRHIEKAVLIVEAQTPELKQAIKGAKDKLYQIRKEFYGDNIASRLDKGSEFSIASRVGWMTGEMWGSTSAPTQTQREALKLADEAFQPLLNRIKQVRDQDLKTIEQKLEDAGAPYTPGRNIEYGKQ